MIDAELRAALLNAEEILNTHYSVDLAEPVYKKCLELIAGFPSERPQVESVLLQMFYGREVSHETLAYLMHVLRWPHIRIDLESKARTLANPIVEGVDIAKVLEAYDDSWEDREFYKF